MKSKMKIPAGLRQFLPQAYCCLARHHSPSARLNFDFTILFPVFY